MIVKRDLASHSVRAQFSKAKRWLDTAQKSHNIQMFNSASECDKSDISDKVSKTVKHFTGDKTPTLPLGHTQTRSF